MDFVMLAQQCAPAVHHQTMAVVARIESSFNPYAIGVVGGQLKRQPMNKAEAIATAKSLEAAGFNFSLGVSQVNRFNLPKYGIDFDKAFDACENLRVGSLILKDCFDRAKPRFKDEQKALQAAFSCYYSGNFSTGFRTDFPGQPSYVQKVLNEAVAANASMPINVIPVAKPKTELKARDETPFRVTAETAGAFSAPAAASVYGSAKDSVMVFQ